MCAARCLPLLALLPAACASIRAPAGFLDHLSYASMKEGPSFKREHLEPKADPSKYVKVKIEPVDLSFLDDKSQAKLSRQEKDRLRASFEAALKAQLGEKHRVLDAGENPDEETLVITPALIYLRSPHRALNALTTLALFLPVTFGAAAFEAKMRAGPAGKDMAQVAEQRCSWGDDLKTFLVGPFTKFSQIEVVFRKWALHLKEFVEKDRAGASG